MKYKFVDTIFGYFIDAGNKYYKTIIQAFMIFKVIIDMFLWMDGNKEIFLTFENSSNGIEQGLFIAYKAYGQSFSNPLLVLIVFLSGFGAIPAIIGLLKEISILRKGYMESLERSSGIIAILVVLHQVLVSLTLSWSSFSGVIIYIVSFLYPGLFAIFILIVFTGKLDKWLLPKAAKILVDFTEEGKKELTLDYLEKNLTWFKNQIRNQLILNQIVTTKLSNIYGDNYRHSIYNQILNINGKNYGFYVYATDTGEEKTKGNLDVRATDKTEIYFRFEKIPGQEFKEILQKEELIYSERITGKSIREEKSRKLQDLYVHYLIS